MLNREQLVHFDLGEIIKTFGYLGMFAIIFAESGLLIGLLLPGDSLLFTAGFLASQKNPATGEPWFDITVLTLGCFIAAVSGDAVGYTFGYRVGRPLFQREDSRFFKRRHLLKAEEFYQKHGGKAIILARFMPAIRTLVPIVAGAAHMRYRDFAVYNFVGGLIWAVGMTLGGYFLGNLIPDPDRFLLPILAVIILASAVPGVWHVVQERRKGGEKVAG
jgi:membrane-associated protein